jgi:hypothetical protein
MKVEKVVTRMMVQIEKTRSNFDLKMHLRKMRYLSYAKFLLVKRHSIKRREFDR